MVVGSIGHTPAILESYGSDLFEGLYNIAYDWLNSNFITELVTDLNLGWGLAVAKAAVDSHITITSAIPYMNQELLWPHNEKQLYRELFTKGTVVFISAGGYDPTKRALKDKWVVDNSDKLLVLYNGIKYSGMGDCVNYAASRNKEVTNVFNKLIV